jgi:uncharacterized cofD-like protein
MHSVVNPLLSKEERDLVEIIYQKRQLERGPKIVALGGGTGLSMLLHGLKNFTNNLTAIVTVTDEGGSSGKLRSEFGVLPPGDIRNCLVALAETEPLMQNLFQFRFEEDSGLSGHNFGNLFITAMSKLTGDFEEAIKLSSKILAIRGQVLPSTTQKVRLVAEYADGSRQVGETAIAQSRAAIRKLYLEPKLCTPGPEVLRAIEEAEAIILGPGSLYTSVIPNLLVKGVVEAMMASRALKIYVCNVMTQAGETDNLSACQHLKTIINHSHPKIIDVCLLNNASAPQGLLERYRQENAFPVAADTDKIKKLNVRALEKDLISTQDYVRHDPEKLARIIVDLIIDYKLEKKKSQK